MIPAVAKQRHELRRLCLRYGVQRLSLFGSAASGTHSQEKSDLDFLLEFSPTALAGYADAYFGLLEALEQLFGTTVDLVMESAIRTRIFWSPWSERERPSFKPEASKYLYDIQRAANLLTTFTDSITLPDCVNYAMA